MLRQHATLPRAIAEELPPQRVDRLPPAALLDDQDDVFDSQDDLAGADDDLSDDDDDLWSDDED